MEQDRQDQSSHIEHVPTSPERAQESGEAAQVSASAEHAVYEATKLDEHGPIVEPDETLRERIVELEQLVQNLRELIKESQRHNALKDHQLAELRAERERERAQIRESDRRYRERNLDKVRERKAAWMRAKRARERGQDGQSKE